MPRRAGNPGYVLRAKGVGVTARELAVLGGLWRGETVKEICRAEAIAEARGYEALARLRRRLEARTIPHLCRRAVQVGLLEP